MYWLRRWAIAFFGCVVALASSSRTQPVTAQTRPGLDRNILVADRGNNRIIEITPDKRIVWEYHFEGLAPGNGADDAFFSPDNSKVVANLEFENTVVVIDYATREIVWRYGEHKHGSGPNQLYRADDSYMLTDGSISITDIGNCRVIVVSPSRQILRQYGKTGLCLDGPGYYDHPNGATPLPNGHFLITEIGTRRITEINSNGKRMYSFIGPAAYPSDANPTPRGTIFISDYQPNGAIYELDRAGRILWQYLGLNQPSLAVEMPNGTVITNDDYNHRVIVIDKSTRQIVWQYGHTGIPGDGDDYLNIPDGLDWRHSGEATADGLALPEATVQPMIGTSPVSTPFYTRTPDINPPSVDRYVPLLRDGLKALSNIQSVTVDDRRPDQGQRTVTITYNTQALNAAERVNEWLAILQPVLTTIQAQSIDVDEIVLTGVSSNGPVGQFTTLTSDLLAYGHDQLSLTQFLGRAKYGSLQPTLTPSPAPIATASVQ